MSTPAIRIQLVDDHEIVRTGFRHLLEKEGDLRVVAESASGKQACRDYDTYLPDILIMDISLPDISGLEAMRRILDRHPQARILVLSMHTGMVAEQAMQLGAMGFVCKRSGATALVSAIRAIMAGQHYVDAKEDESIPGERFGSRRLRPASLTKRELEICMHVAEGRSVAEIARAMHLSEKTVYTHRQHIMDKLGVDTPVRLARILASLGLQT
ncbi:MAG TPA: response regulator transcription factor [Mariprofundaceae bacterium]|nr:response regulator transcription factor [Mariprofundaceae bacterium]